jgi:hypothetical protein
MVYLATPWAAQTIQHRMIGFLMNNESDTPWKEAAMVWTTSGYKYDYKLSNMDWNTYQEILHSTSKWLASSCIYFYSYCNSQCPSRLTVQMRHSCKDWNWILTMATLVAQTRLWWRPWWGLAKSAFGVSWESGGWFCVINLYFQCDLYIIDLIHHRMSTTICLPELCYRALVRSAEWSPWVSWQRLSCSRSEVTPLSRQASASPDTLECRGRWGLPSLLQHLFPYIWNTQETGDISGFHGDEYEDGWLSSGMLCHIVW